MFAPRLAGVIALILEGGHALGPRHPGVEAERGRGSRRMLRLNPVQGASFFPRSGTGVPKRVGHRARNSVRMRGSLSWRG